MIVSSLQQTPWLHNTSSFANSSEHRRYVEGILKEELGTMYVGLPGFRDAYFGGVVGLEAASKQFFAQCLHGSDPFFQDGWKGWPQDANESSVLEWLMDFVKKLAVFDTQKSNTTHQRRLLAQPNTPMQGSTADRKLDVGNPSADTASKAWLDLGRYAREVLAAQDPRCFVLGFTLCGSLMRVWAFDRLGAIASEQFDINKDGLQFVSTVLGFLCMDEEALGLDPTIMASDNKRFIEIKRNGSTERIVIDEVILRARCVAGRAATCWKAHPEGHPETPLVIKDSWQYPERDEEGDLLCEVMDKGVVNVARYYHHETVQVHKTDDDIWNNVRHGLDITLATNYRAGLQTSLGNMARDAPWKGRSSNSRKRPSSQSNPTLPPSKRSSSASPTKAPSTPPNRVHRCIILQDYGKPIYKASSRSALLAVLVGCIEGHESLLKAGILHRDISINNLMINEDSGNPSWPAFLIDLDLAIREPREGESGAKGKRGTRAFMATGALLGEQHSFMHDLESFFWVLFWICIHYNANGKDVGPTEFDSWNYESDNKLVPSKKGEVTDEEDFLRNAGQNFSSYYQPLIPWINRLRKVVFPGSERWKRPEPGLYHSMKKILHDAQHDPAV
ncbi:serine threonine-protein kinase sgk2 [Colletotrichum sojae]|uniref:non-specific serine/threonine protein kinase n=1 Tax=Colletotrichum sojae TaxID=2175907 RepID=A0A8H6IWY2_9PEZI|nr:serine threonine-protein kinase sgk2 [Colletotrichum sojae]